ncbi:terminase [Flavobacterium selenitireducens]|uniref:terminase n=1 Tax=Flavobacterium selenitireducens TaxID=2722704 RepID=UPI00168BCF95|nr:terminase [Flavobacterium selenitireducens]
MQIEFNTRGNIKQAQAAKLWLDSTTADICYGGSKGSAKSYTGCSLIFGDALIYPGTHYFIARKKLNDLRKYTVPSIHEVFQHWGLSDKYFSYNGNDNFFSLYNESKVYLIDAKYLPSDPDYYRFGSMQMTRGWIEEAGEFELEAKNALSASIGRWKNEKYNLAGKLLQTCNPSKNYLYSNYYKPNKEGTLEPWKAFIQALPTDNKMLDKGYLESLERTLSKNEKERLLFGNWEYDDDPMKLFHDYDKILEVFTNEFVQSNGKRYLTADIAYEGSDLFVMGIWDGLTLIRIEAIDKIDETQVSRKIQELRLKYNVPLSHVIYDADGLKTFVRQSAKTGTLVGARQFHNNGTAIGGENYYNLKSQCYFKLAEFVNESKIYCKDQRYRKQMIEELEQIKKRIRNDDNEPLRLEKKEDIRKRLGRSPDFADMLMMRMLPEISSGPRTHATSPEMLERVAAIYG